MCTWFPFVAFYTGYDTGKVYPYPTAFCHWQTETMTSANEATLKTIEK